ncbi:baculoviral IAP repeat-containing protein 7-like isoform X2 [Watersipora subatra]|uniref:baculoviral IAP repeat-containing protein 7-like isoform X2 n=1 Tax=Watersipora subatra TaxID=2589382 RepID=UPI00355B2256
MPVSNYDGLNDEQRRSAAAYVPGYDWIPGRFGPPPGIPKERKTEFDCMTDKDYLYSFLRLSQEEKESLMVSEKDRRRTFAAHWPIESIVKANDCAKEGFYFTGVADRVQCCFCGGIIRNWERGDVPKTQHKNFFNYCKMVQNKPCGNIPLHAFGVPAELQNAHDPNIVLTRGASDLNISTMRAQHPRLSVYSRRRETYQTYPENSNVDANELCEAGFFYEGVGDKVKCFWCDGALEMWSRGDDPWIEHAKWYPGCTFVQQSKGIDFIKEQRLLMSPDQIATADTLSYNQGNTSFLEVLAAVEPESRSVQTLEVSEHYGFKLCVSMGYEKSLVEQVYEANLNEEFLDYGYLISLIQELEEGNTASLEDRKKKALKRKEQREQPSTQPTASGGSARTRVNVADLVSTQDLTDEEMKKLVKAVECKKCKSRTAGAALLPCGCFCICQECTRGVLPARCPACDSFVKGACRTYLS